MSIAQWPVPETSWSATVVADPDLTAEDQQMSGSGDAGTWVTVLTRVSLLVVDVTVLLGAFLLAYWMRFVAPDAEALALGLDQYIGVGGVIAALVVVLFAFHGFYDDERKGSWIVRLYAIVSTVSTAMALTVTASFLLGDHSFSRLWFAASWALAITGLTIWRTLAHTLDVALQDAFAPTRRILIAGANPLGRQLGRELADAFHVVGFVDNGTDLDGSSELPLLGPIAQLDSLIHSHGVDELIIALPANRREQVSRVIERGFRRPVTVKVVPDMGELLPRRFNIEHIGGRPYIGFAPVAHVSWMKRAMDVLVAGAALLMLAPLFIVLAVAIKLDTPGPVFFQQERMGKNSLRFRMLKFRSMKQDADRQLAELRARNEATGPLFKIRQDPRITRVGRVLRRLSLDELPQLINVLRGEMSLVGPRPPLPSEVAQYEDWQLGRLRAVPGVTGLWQVSGRSEVPFHDMVRLDLHYIRNWSLGLDLEILIRTIPAVLTSRGAY